MTETNTPSEETKIKPILKRKSFNETEYKTLLPSILKKSESFDSNKSAFNPILKRHSLGAEIDQRPLTLSGPKSSVQPILKHKSFDEQTTSHRDEPLLPKPILKKKISADEGLDYYIEGNGDGKAKSILKIDQERKNINTKQEVRGILKTSLPSSTAPVKSALKKAD